MASQPPQFPNQAVLDHHARALGFPDYATYSAWQKNQQVGAKGPGAQQPDQPNVLQRLMGPVYPPTLLKMVGDAYQSATGQ